ncbi:MAG: sulfatase [Candidatus Eiseniibacteriota bacterium]
MKAAPRESSGALPRTIPGAAQGAAALAAVALLEIAGHARSAPALLSPLRDLSLVASAGALLGAFLGLLRGARPLAFLSPFGVALGAGIALHFWLRTVSGAGVLEGGGSRDALRGAAGLAAGAVLGQLLGFALGRTRALRPPPAGISIAFVVLLSLPALLPAPRPQLDESRKNLLLLSIDTLRADRLGASGHPDGLSPHLDRLARTATTHVGAVTPLPRTLPSMSSVMTGLPPHSHGVRDNFHYALGERAETLAEDLARRGWATAAVNSNPVLSHDSGIFQGFASANDRGDDWSRLGLVRGASRIATLLAMRRGDRDAVITELALSWLARRPSGRPFFLWVHWLAPHMPYEPSFPDDRRFDPAYEGAHLRALDYGGISKGDMTYRNPLSPREREHAVRLYDGEVATADRAVGRLLRSVERDRLLDDTVVVLVADHGESLLEHGYFFNHGDFVYGPAAHVPLVVRDPLAPAPILDTAPASLNDVRGMIAAKLEDVPAPPRPDALFCESDFCRFPDLNDRLGLLLPLEVAQDTGPIPDWKERWEEQAIRAKQRFVQREGWRLVRSPRKDGDAHELFDLARDPGETTNVAGENPERLAELALLLDRWISAGEEADDTGEVRAPDEDTQEQMRALGYVGR